MSCPDQPHLDFNHRHILVLAEKPWGTHYRLKAYPVEGRDQFQFIYDLTDRGNAALSQMGIEPAWVLVMLDGNLGKQ
jgi:small conductance mechanosensitive channel